MTNIDSTEILNESFRMQHNIVVSPYNGCRSVETMSATSATLRGGTVCQQQDGLTPSLAHCWAYDYTLPEPPRLCSRPSTACSSSVLVLRWFRPTKVEGSLRNLCSFLITTRKWLWSQCIRSHSTTAPAPVHFRPTANTRSSASSALSCHSCHNPPLTSERVPSQTSWQTAASISRRDENPGRKGEPARHWAFFEGA